MSTLTDLIAEYLDTFDKDKQKQTVKTYRFGLRQFVMIVGENAELNEATYIQFLDSTKGMHPATQAACRSSISGLYGYAAFNKLIPPLDLRPATKYHGRKQGERDIIDPDLDRIEKVLSYANTLTGDLIALRDRAFIITLAETGLRISEACALTRGQVNWKKGRAVVIGKGDKQAIVRFSVRSLSVIQDYLKARAKIDGASGRPLSSLPLFARHDMSAKKTPKPVTTKGMWRSIRDRIDESGVEDADAIRIHDFRHYFVSRVVKETGNLKLAQVLARHERIETTNRYAHLGGEEDKAYDEIFNK